MPPQIEQVKFSTLCNFQPKQLVAERTLFSNDCKYLLYGGAAAGGKSYWLRWTALELVLYYTQKYNLRNVPVGLFCIDYPSLKDRQLTKISQEFPEWLGKLKETRDEGLVFKLHERYGSGSILPRNLDDPTKYKSVEFAGIAVDEITENPEGTFEDLRFRLRYPKVPDPRFICASNPGGIGHGYVLRLFVEPDPNSTDPEKELFKYVPAYYSDNRYIDKSYVNQLASLPETKRKAYMEGNWHQFEGQFFAEFRTALHVIDPFTPELNDTKIGGIDWGYTAPFVFEGAVARRVKAKTGESFVRVKVYKEVEGTKKTPEEWGEHLCHALPELPAYKYIRCDPSMFNKKQDGSMPIAAQMSSTMGDSGYLLRGGSNDRQAGWAYLHKWLSIAPDGLPYLQIAKNCHNLITRLPEAVFAKNDTEDINTDGWDHELDALRYMLMHVKFIDARVGGVASSSQMQKIPKLYTPITDFSAFENT